MGEVFAFRVQKVGNGVGIETDAKSANVQLIHGGNLLEEFLCVGAEARVIPQDSVPMSQLKMENPLSTGKYSN